MNATASTRPTGTIAAACLLLVGAVWPAGAQSVPEGWPERIGSQTVEKVATLWDTEAADIRLEWGPYSGAAPLDTTLVELVGSGRGGHWIIRYTVDGTTTAVRVRAGRITSVPVAARPLRRGATVTTADYTVRDSLVWGPPTRDAIPIPDGFTANRNIRFGEVLDHPTVQPPTAVAAQDPVRLVWQRGGVRVTVAGTARGTGTIGDDIWVRTEGGERLRGTIIEPGVVRVTAGAGHHEEEDRS